MVTIQERTMQKMSVVIGVCGLNFCTLISDGRRVVNTGTGFEPIEEDFQKIRKLNNRALFGATGLFAVGEDAFAAVNDIPNIEAASVKIVKNSMKEYVESNINHFTVTRTYIIGGKESSGFVLYELHYDSQKGKVVVVERRPNKTFNFGISAAIPPTLIKRKGEILDAIGRIVSVGGAHGNMVKGVGGLIGEIAKVDPTVNDHITSLSIF